LLFSFSKLMLGIATFWAIRDSVVSASQCCMRYVERLSSASEALKLMCSIGRKLMREYAVLAETDSLAGLSHSLVKYVNSNTRSHVKLNPNIKCKYLFVD
jgi:hypothetical protein